VRGASSGGDLKLCIRVNGSRSGEQSGGVCVPVVDVVAVRGRLAECGLQSRSSNRLGGGISCLPMREQPRRGGRASTVLEGCLLQLLSGMRLMIETGHPMLC
jgi:hypothetical protein